MSRLLQRLRYGQTTALDRAIRDLQDKFHKSTGHSHAGTLDEGPVVGLGMRYNVRTYGAVGNNSTDDTTAIQNAINACILTGGIVWFPGGYTYKTTATLTITNVAAQDSQFGVRLLGEGINSTLSYTGSANAIEIADANSVTPGGWEIADLHLKGTSSATGGIVVNPSGAGLSPIGLTIRDVWVDTFSGTNAIGIKVTRAGHGLYIVHNTIDDCYTGIQLGELANVITIFANHILLWNKYGIGVVSTAFSNGVVNILANRIEGTRNTGRTAADPSIGIYTTYSQAPWIAGNRFESTDDQAVPPTYDYPMTPIILDTFTRKAKIERNYLHGNVDPINIKTNASDTLLLWNDYPGPATTIVDNGDATTILEPDSDMVKFWGTTILKGINATDVPLTIRRATAGSTVNILEITNNNDTADLFTVSYQGTVTIADGQYLQWSDVNLYRSAANVLKTDDDFVVNASSLTVGVNPATTGCLRLPNNVWIQFRNAANNADLNGIAMDTNNDLAIGGDLRVIGAASFNNVSPVPARPTISGSRMANAALADLLTDLASIGLITDSTTASAAEILYINDTANANMTVGLTLNQGANDNEIIALKSSDVAHGMTTEAETDTYGSVAKYGATDGGLQILGLTAASIGLYAVGQGVTDITTKSTAGDGYIVLEARKKTGSTYTNAGTDANLLVVRNSSTTRFIWDAEGTLHSLGTTATDSLGNGLWFLNDTANANMTLGLTLNQGANDNEILALKSSDVAHGITTNTETDTYGAFKKSSALLGGLQIAGWHELIGGLDLLGVGVSDSTAKSTAGLGYVNILAGKKTGTTYGACGADANLLAIIDNTNARFLFDAEGDSHEDGTGWTAYDAHDDVGLLELVNATLVKAKDPIKTEFWAWVADNARMLQDLKLISFNSNNHHFINRSKMQELLVGAVRQSALRITQLEGRLRALEARP